MGIMYSYRIIYLPSWSFLGKAFLSYQLHKVWETNMSFDLELWPTDLNTVIGQIIRGGFNFSMFASRRFIREIKTTAISLQHFCL